MSKVNRAEDILVRTIGRLLEEKAEFDADAKSAVGLADKLEAQSASKHIQKAIDALQRLGYAERMAPR